MKAIFDGRDYTLILEEGKEEMSKVKTSKLETVLKDYFEEKTFDKIVTLNYDSTIRQPDGVEISYVPPDTDWAGIKTIEFKINQRAIYFLESQGSVITRQITDDKITIYNGLPYPSYRRF